MIRNAMGYRGAPWVTMGDAEAPHEVTTERHGHHVLFDMGAMRFLMGDHEKILMGPMGSIIIKI